MKQNWERQKKIDEKDFSENEINLNSLKLFEFEPKRNTADIDSSSSDDEEGVEYKSKTDRSQRVMRV